MKKTVVFGATPNPQRYAHIAALRLQRYGHPIELVGRREGEIGGIPIQTDWPVIEDVDTLTLYIGGRNQPPFYDYFFSLNPKRIIFNPGTENEELRQMAEDKGIETEYACTLVMLSVGQY